MGASCGGVAFIVLNGGAVFAAAGEIQREGNERGGQSERATCERTSIHLFLYLN